MKIIVTDVRTGDHVPTSLVFSGPRDEVWDEWQSRVWPLLVPVERTRFEVALLGDDGELLEVGGLDERGFTRLNEAPPSPVEIAVPFEP